MTRKITLARSGYDPALGRKIRDPTLEGDILNPGEFPMCPATSDDIPVKLLSITQAAAAGIDRIRQTLWANPFDHIKLDIINGKPGPWLHLFSPLNKWANKRDPVDILWIVPPAIYDANTEMFVPYTGPLPDSQEYKAEVAKFEQPA